MLLVVVALFSGTALSAETPKVVDQLSPHDLEVILEAVKEHYFAPAKVSGEGVQRATVEGLLTRLRGGVQIESKDAVAPIDSAFRSELLGTSVLYLRM